MNFVATEIEGLFIVEDEPHPDARGSFCEAFTERVFSEHGFGTLEKLNFSESRQPGTIRGLHWQEEPLGQIKLVRCTRGAVFDVAVDLRPGSPTRGRHHAEVLTDTNGKAIYIPIGFAHGWQSITENAQIVYLVGNAPWSLAHERGLHPKDKLLNIPWPLQAVNLSDRDASWPAFSGMV